MSCQDESNTYVKKYIHYFQLNHFLPKILLIAPVIAGAATKPTPAPTVPAAAKPSRSGPGEQGGGRGVEVVSGRAGVGASAMVVSSNLPPEDEEEGLLPPLPPLPGGRLPPPPPPPLPL